MSDRVLIVEDEPKLAQLLDDYFVDAGFTTAVCLRGDTAMEAFRRQPAVLVVLDLQLPGRDGLSLCRALQDEPTAPAIMMVTARVDEVDRLLGLELGADDYVCKPFSPREVVARAKAILRRARPDAGGDVLRHGELVLDRARRRLTAAGQDVTMTPSEFGLVEAMLAQPERVFSRADLLARIQGHSFEGYERNIDGHVKNIRRKLRAALDGRDPVRSVYGVGYGLQGDESS